MQLFISLKQRNNIIINGVTVCVFFLHNLCITSVTINMYGCFLLVNCVDIVAEKETFLFTIKLKSIDRNNH